MSENVKKFFEGFGYAITGIKTGAIERNFRFHTFAAIVVISASFYFRISPLEWLAVLFCIGAVMSVELVNSAIESTCNIIKHQLHLDYHATYDPRNLAAGAVLLISLASTAIGLVIFLPKILLLLS